MAGRPRRLAAGPWRLYILIQFFSPDRGRKLKRTMQKFPRAPQTAHYSDRLKSLSLEFVYGRCNVLPRTGGEGRRRRRSGARDARPTGSDSFQ